MFGALPREEQQQAVGGNVVVVFNVDYPRSPSARGRGEGHARPGGSLAALDCQTLICKPLQVQLTQPPCPAMLGPICYASLR
jgi:hypothetical protein